MRVVKEIEPKELSSTGACRKYGVQARSTVVSWLQKFGNFDWENQTSSNIPKSPEQKITEPEAQAKLLQKQKALLEKQAYVADKKAIIFDMMINLAEQEYQIDIRKNSPPKLSNLSEKSKKKP